MVNEKPTRWFFNGDCFAMAALERSGKDNMDLLEVGALVRNPQAPEWGLGQVQSIIGYRVTVNFEDAGKQVIDRRVVELELIEFDR